LWEAKKYNIEVLHWHNTHTGILSFVKLGPWLKGLQKDTKTHSFEKNMGT